MIWNYKCAFVIIIVCTVYVHVYVYVIIYISISSGDGSTGTVESTFSQESPREQQPTSASERQVPRPPRPHPLPPRLTIHAIPAPPQELGPPVQV